MFGARTRKHTHGAAVAEESGRQRKADSKGADAVEAPPPVVTCHSHAHSSRAVSGTALIPSAWAGLHAEGPAAPRSFRGVPLRRLILAAAGLSCLLCVLGILFLGTHARGAYSGLYPTGARSGTLTGEKDGGGGGRDSGARGGGGSVASLHTAVLADGGAGGGGVTAATGPAGAARPRDGPAGGGLGGGNGDLSSVDESSVGRIERQAGSPRRTERADGATSSFLDPYAHLSAADALSATDESSFDFDENGRRIRHRKSEEESFVAFNHPPKLDASPLDQSAPAPHHGHPNRTSHRNRPAAAPLPSSPGDKLRLKYRSRKFLFPLLDQGPNNQYLQFRVALALAKALNRTLVLPLWLPHNPKFRHLHPGAPPEPSRDRETDALAFPFASTFDDALLSRFVRTVNLPTFRNLTEGRLELCLCPGGTHPDASGFEPYLRHSGLSCANFSSTSDERRERALTSSARFLGYHLFDHEAGMRDKIFYHLRPSPRVLALADEVSAELFNRTQYVGAHIRVADAHWEHSDCHHSINGLPVPSISCGDGVNAINYSSIAQEIWYVLRQSELKILLVATNMNCSDWRLLRIGLMLSRRSVRLVCARDTLRGRVAREFAIDEASPAADVQINYYVSLVEQELCLRAHSFIGSKYSTWTDTVRGERQAAAIAAKAGAEQWLFEELWALGVR